MTTGYLPSALMYSMTLAGSSKVSYFAVGMPYFFIRSLEKTLEALRPHYPEGRLARFVEEGAGHTLTPLMARVGLAFLEHWLEAR